MSKLPNSPYVEASQIIDTDQNKPYELIHQRYFNNIIIKSGWKASTDGLFNYYLDVKLPVKSGEAPITLAYSPEIIIPENANTTCRPSNFPYARTVGINTVRIYAIKVPKSTDMLPVVIHMRAVGTSEGTTNSRPETGGSDIQVDRYSFQATGTNFYVEVDEDNKTVKQEKLTVTVMAFKGEKRIEPYLQDTKLTELVYNLDGTLVSGIPAAVPTTIITDPKNPTKSMTITIPKGTILKDRQAYITFGVTGVANTGFTYTMRAVIYTNLSDKNVSTSFIYDVKMPFFSRKTSGNVYYADGEVVSALNGYDLQVTATTLNNEVSQPNGSLKLYKVSGDTKTLINTLTVSAGEVNLNPSALFDGVRDFEYEFVVSGAVVYQNQSTITQHGDEIILRTDPQYVIPTIVNTPEGEKFEVPSIRVTSSFIGPTGLFVDYHGFFVIKTSDGESIYDSVAAESRVNTPIKQYVQSELPGNYVIELYEVKPTSGAEPMARAFVSIPREGETELPYIMDLSPNSLVIPTTSDNEIGQSIDFAATILRGVTDVSGDWNFSIATSSETLESYGIEITQNLNIFTLVQFSGPQLSAVIKIKAQNKEDSTLVYNKDIVFAKLRENDDMGNYTFTRYGELNDEGEIVFTTDPMDQVGPGIVVGPFIGIATSSIQEVPPASEFKWLPVDQQGNQGEPGETAAAFYIDGRSLVKANVVDGEVLYSPFSSNYSVEKWYDGVNDPVSIEWSVTTSNKDIGLYTSVMGNLLELTFSEVFDMTDEINITATIQVEIDGEIVTYRATKDVFLIYSDQNEYFSKQDGLNIPQDRDYTFEIDKNGNAFKGVAKSGNPVKIGFESYKGNTKLQYNPDLLNIDRLDFEETGDIEVELPQVGGYTFEDLSGSWASYGGTWEQLSLYGDESQGEVLGRNYILDSAENIDFSELEDVETSVQDFEIGGRNYLLNSGDRVDFEEQDVIPTTVGEYLPIETFKGGRNYWIKDGNKSFSSYNTEPIIKDGVLKVTSNSTTGLWAINNADRRMEKGVLYFISMKIKKNGRALLPNEVPRFITTRQPEGDFDGTYNEETFEYRVSQTGNNDLYWFHTRFGNKEVGDYLEIWDISYKKVDDFEYSPAPEDFNNLKGKSYALSQPLQKENILSLNGSFEEDDFIGLWLRDDKFIGFLDNQELTFDLGGRNLFSVNQYVSLRNSEGTTNGNRYSVGSSGALVVDGIDGSVGYDTKKMVDLKANTEYIFTFNIPINDRFSLYDTDGVVVSVAKEWNSDNTQLTFKMGSVDGYIGGKFYPIEQSYPVEIYLMAEKGSTPTPWTPAPEDFDGTEFVVVKTLSEKGIIDNAKLEKGNVATDWAPAPEDLQHAHTYNLTTPIQPNTKYQLQTSNYEDDWYGAWLGEDYFAGYLEEGHLEIDVDFTVNKIIIKSLKSTSISHIKLEPGSTATPYTPALEDFIYAKELPLAIAAMPGEDYSLSLVSDDWVTAWLGTDRFLGFVREGGLQIIFEEEKVPLEQRDKVILKVFNKDAVIRGISLRNTFQSEYFYYLDNLLAEGAVVRPIINGNDLAIEFVDIISRSGYIDTTLRMNGHLKTHRFIFNTIVTANNKPPQVSLQLSNSVIKINNATVKDMQNWDDTMAASYSDSFENSNSPIILLPEVRNTNIDSIWYSKNGQNYLQFSYESQYVGVPTEEEEFAPILPLNLYYDWKEYIGSAFVTAEKYYLLIIERDDSVNIDFFANNEILHSKEITQNNYYIPGESTNGSYTGKKVVLIKAPAGAEIIKVKQGLDGVNIPEGEQNPYAKPPELFYLEPPSRALRILNAATYDSGVINMDAFSAQVGEDQIYRYLPVGHILPEGSLISIETQPSGTGYFVIDPKIAANPNFFDNTHTDTHSSIKVNVVDDESSYSISISRSITPYNDLDQIRSDLKDSLNGEWFYHSDLSGLKRTLAALLETKDEILEQLAEDEVFITIAEEDPVAARAEILSPEREELVGNEFIKVQGEYSLNIFQENITDPGKKVNSVFGTTVHEDNSYILRFKLSHSLSGNQTVGTKFVDMLNGDEFELDLNDIPQAGKVFEFFIPKLGGELTEAIQTYLGKHGFSNQPLVLADRDRKIPQKYTTYYMRFTNENVTEKNQLIMSDFEFKQIKPETEIRNPKYEGIDPQNMVTLVSGFESRVNSLESALNLSEDNRIEVPSDIYQDYVDIEKEIKNLRILISKQLRDSFDKAIFQTYQGADSYTIGFNTASEWLSSLTVSSEGTLMRGDHHQIIGSASIGTLYGKKFVIGKTPDARDINFDKTYDGDGLIAIWEDDELSGGRWSSLLDSDGHQFYRYEIQEGNINAIRGYMIMNSTEIAAYQLDEAYYDISDTMPPKLLDRSAQAIFKIKDNGSVAINQLEISGRGASANFMETIQFMRYERGEEGSEDNKKRRGMVIIGIGGEN